MADSNAPASTSGPLARRIDHVSFAVRDLALSLVFYRDLLGLAPAPRPDLGFAGAWLTIGEAQIHLLEVPEGFDGGTPPPALNPMASHAAFAIDDYEAAAARLKARGLEVFEIGNGFQMWVKDPDGNIIEFISAGR